MDINTNTFIKNAIATAEHFGFRSVDAIKSNPACKNCTDKIVCGASSKDKKADALSGTLTAGTQLYCDARLNALDEPVMFYALQEVPRTGDLALSLQIYNVDKSIAEALLIQTSRALAEDLGYTNNRVRINSLGDKESITRYTREITNFLRKRIDDIPDQARELMKDHPLYALNYLIEKEHEFAYRSPNPLEFLSDQSRRHFREIVEFLDMADVHYEIDPKLMGHHECYNDALFTIDMLDDDMVTIPDTTIDIRGGRYNEFVNRATKQNISAAGAVITLRGKKVPARIPRATPFAPQAYMVHLGFGPKIKSLVLLDHLRRAGVSVEQYLASDSLSAQLRTAEHRGAKHVIIMGQKEFVENTVILRDMEARNQENVPIDQLARRLTRVG